MKVIDPSVCRFVNLLLRCWIIITLDTSMMVSTIRVNSKLAFATLQTGVGLRYMIPSTEVTIIVIVASFFGGLSTGVTGFGSSIVIQIIWRVSASVFGADLGDEDTSAKTVLAITTTTGLAQAIVGGIAAYRAHKYKTSIIAYLLPGTNIFMFAGTLAAVALKQDVLSKSLGCVLIFVAIWQFTSMNVITFKRERKAKQDALAAGLSSPLGTASGSAQTSPTSISSSDGMVRDQHDSNANPVNGINDTVNGSMNGTVAHGDDDDLRIMAGDRENENGEGDINREGETDSSCCSWSRFTTALSDCCTHISENKGAAAGGFFVGCLSGFTSGAFGVGGPPVMIYFTLLALEGTIIRDTYMMVCFLSLPFLIGARFYFEIFRSEDWFVYLVSAGVVNVGLKLGYMLHPYVNTTIILIILQVFVILSSIPLTKPLDDDGGFGIFILFVYAAVCIYTLVVILWRYYVYKQDKLMNADTSDALTQASSLDALKSISPTSTTAGSIATSVTQTGGDDLRSTPFIAPTVGQGAISLPPMTLSINMSNTDPTLSGQQSQQDEQDTGSLTVISARGYGFREPDEEDPTAY